ncbi:MAG: carboxypeptidase-like regulatory domain-containing protein, partial [Prolixibacteraceae bacterium]|nr:carboxypeptidase-like regulatory domain-containing protein [Prolixibacteraceae bacterium]
MKLLTLMLFAAFVSASASSYSQATKFNLDLKNVSISDVFQKIEEQSEFVILFNEKTFDIKRKVDIAVRDETVDKILDQVFEGEKDAYKIFDRQIAIYPNEIIELPTIIKSETNAEQQKKTLSGIVKDSKGLPIPGVTVIAKATTIGTITDADGQFILSVPTDAKTLVFSFIGMKTQEIQIGGKTSLNVVLEEMTVSLEEVVAVGYGTQKKASVVGAISAVSGKDIMKTGGVSSLSMALTGALPGLNTIQSNTGQP